MFSSNTKQMASYCFICPESGRDDNSLLTAHSLELVSLFIYI
jgi:hypothetical protein